MELVTLKTFDNPVEAHILKSRLESEDIPSFLFDENMVTLNPLYNVTVGGIKLKVNPAHYEEAKQIIDDFNTSEVRDENEEIISCPNCSSKDLYTGFKSMKGLKGVMSGIVAFLLMIYPFYLKTMYKCKSCNTEFKS